MPEKQRGQLQQLPVSLPEFHAVLHQSVDEPVFLRGAFERAVSDAGAGAVPDAAGIADVAGDANVACNSFVAHAVMFALCGKA